jgi:hypothetical protein
MSPYRVVAAACLAFAVTSAGCGGGGDDDASPPPRAATSTTPAQAPLARAPVKAGELVFAGETSPITYGAFELDGRYVVRFEQFAPENPKLDFSTQTPFTARIRRAGSRTEGEELFSSASASGKRVIAKRGRYELEVTFGDFPHAVRFTPQR